MRLKNGIRPAMRDVMAETRACITTVPDQGLELEHPYAVDSTGDRVRLSRLTVRPTDGTSLPSETAACLDQLGTKIYQTTAKQILSPELQRKYGTDEFFLRAVFEDKEIVTVTPTRMRIGTINAGESP
jgi:hypothetical protein